MEKNGSLSNYEFSRILLIKKFNYGETKKRVEATSAECQAIASRFDLISLDYFSGQLSIFKKRRSGLDLTIGGRFSASYQQSCVATLQPLQFSIDQTVSASFSLSKINNIDIDPFDNISTELVSNGKIDFGEFLIQNFAVEINPFPRTSNIDFINLESGSTKFPKTENENTKISPFSILKTLKLK
jgi:uncharacterized metal-binding protein YceD (DUF177 family)